MFLLYDFIFLLYALVYLPYLLLTRRGYAGFGIRFGLFPSSAIKQIKVQANIWLHAVSVGEVMVLDGFIEQLRKKYPEYQLIVTVTTKTGFALACERLRDRALVLPSPIDFSFVTKSFVSLINPKIYVAVETEIWPNLYRQLSRNRIPLVVINGRISDASFGRYKVIRFLLKGILNQVSAWCMQAQGDAQRIKELGAESSRVFVTGNVKFDDLPKPVDSLISNLESSKDEFWWVAGSTHPGEEEIVLDVYSKIIKENPKWRLVIAPRHVERVARILELVSQKGFKAVRFKGIASSLKNAPHNDTVVIVDTIGQLRSLYAVASLVFVGKSLCVGGGHNIIEPAIYGKAVIIGPKCQNFRDIVACFKAAKAIVQVEDARSFEMAVKELSSDPVERDRLGVAAKKVIIDNQGATRRSLEHLSGFLK